MPLLFTSLLIVVVVGLVLEPVFRSPAFGEQAVLPGPDPRRHLEEQRKMIYDNVKDLEFEYQAGKLSEEDYQRTRQEYMTEAGGLPNRSAKRRSLPKPCTEQQRGNDQDQRMMIRAA